MLLNSNKIFFIFISFLAELAFALWKLRSLCLCMPDCRGLTLFGVIEGHVLHFLATRTIFPHKRSFRPDLFIWITFISFTVNDRPIFIYTLFLLQRISIFLSVAIIFCGSSGFDRTSFFFFKSVPDLSYFDNMVFGNEDNLAVRKAD